MLIVRPNTYMESDPAKRRWHEDLYKLINRNISFGTQVNSKDQNIQGQMVEIPDSGAVNSPIVIIHNLGYIPKFYDIKYLNQPAQIYDAGTAWTKTKIYLACSTAHTKFRVFVH